MTKNVQLYKHQITENLKKIDPLKMFKCYKHRIPENV